MRDTLGSKGRSVLRPRPPERLIFRGTRIPVADALELLNDGRSAEQVSAEYRGIVSAAAVREAASLVRRSFLREMSRAAFCSRLFTTISQS